MKVMGKEVFRQSWVKEFDKQETLFKLLEVISKKFEGKD